MANDENKFERMQEEKRIRERQDDIDAQRAKELMDKIHKQRDETLRLHREKLSAEEAYKSYGTHGLDFSGHELHGENKISEKMHSGEPDTPQNFSSHNEIQSAKLSGKPTYNTSDSGRSKLSDDYMRQMSENYRERRETEYDKTNLVRTSRIPNGNAHDKQNNTENSRQGLSRQASPDINRNTEVASNDKYSKTAFSSYGFNKVHTNHIENGAVTYSGSVSTSSSGDMNISNRISVELGTATSRNSLISSLSIGKDTYMGRTIKNLKQNGIRQDPVAVQESVSALSEKTVRFQYSKKFFQNAANTTEQVYKTVGKSVYRTASQRSNYDTIHNFEQARRAAVGTVAAICVIGNMPRNTTGRVAALGSYTKATVGSLNRYVKGNNSNKVLDEIEELRNLAEPLSPLQKQRYEFLETQLQKNAPTRITPVTLKQIRTEMRRVFTVSQYKELAGKYGSLVKLSLPEIQKQISTLSKKQELGIISDFQQRKLKRLSELKEIHTAALKENGQLMKLSSRQVCKEIQSLQKLQDAGALTSVQKIRLEKLTELNSLHTLKAKIQKNIRAKHKLSANFTRLIRQIMSKTEDAGVNGLFMATDFCTNRYTRTIVREIAKLSKLSVQKPVQLGVWGAKKISDKTGLTKQINTLKTKTTKKLRSTNPVQTVSKLKGKINGELYSKIRLNISAKAPQGLKTTVKNTKTAVNTVKKTSDKISKTVWRGYRTVTKPFVKIKEIVGKVVKFTKGAVLAAGGILIFLYILIAIVSVISSAQSSVILEDVTYLNEYIELLNDKQTEFKEKLTDLGDGYKNVTYSYTDGSKMNNTREILCMATVYFQQDFTDKEAIKSYLTQMFNASHFYTTEESETYYCSDGEGCDNKKIDIYIENGAVRYRYICQGHKDLSVTITALAFDEIFSASLNATGVGDLCFAFETGGQTLGSYNCWYCEDISDGAGMNYGMMSTNRSQAISMWNYIKANSENFSHQFAGIDGFTGSELYPFSDAFNQKWRGTHSPEDTAEMEQLQRAWVWNAYGTIWCADLQSRTGVDMTRSWALSEVALSRAVHRGAYSASVFSGCVNSSMTDEQIIDAIYDFECSHLPSFMSRWNLERSYAKTFLGRDFPTDDTDQFSWTEDNIEWCKNLYEQDWDELYDGLIGLNSATVGSSMSDAEVEALIGSLDGLSEERKNILSWACSAVGKIPYHWDWRSYWTIDADDWGTVTTPDYKGRNLKGLDCSGFVIWCYYKAGFDPVTCGWGAQGWTGSIADSPKTYKISNSELKPGDIGMAGANSYTHTGIYAGNGKWIHCTGEPTNNTVCNSYGGFTTYYRMSDLD